MGDGIREFDITDISTPLPNKDWTNYVRGVLVELQKRNHTVTGFQALVTSDIPQYLTSFIRVHPQYVLVVRHEM